MKNYLLKNMSTGQEIGLYSNYKKIATEYNLKDRLNYHFSRLKKDKPFLFEHEGIEYSVTRFLVQ
jgi:hypothetical protein